MTVLGGVRNHSSPSACCVLILSFSSHSLQHESAIKVLLVYVLAVTNPKGRRHTCCLYIPPRELLPQPVSLSLTTCQLCSPSYCKTQHKVGADGCKIQLYCKANVFIAATDTGKTTLELSVSFTHSVLG